MPAVSDSAQAPAPSPAATPAPAAAAAVEKRLVDGGLTAGLASDLVGEAVTHGLPFAGPRGLKKLVRSALTRRLPVMADMGPDSRVVAFVGTGGSGKSNAIAHIATAYANAGASVAVVALRSPDGGRALAAKLEPLGVSVLTSDADVKAAKKRLDGSSPLLTLIDTPAASPADAAGVAALASQLKALGATEVHLALPATLSAQAGEELAAAMRPLGLTHLALTRADETSRPGAVVELAIALPAAAVVPLRVRRRRAPGRREPRSDASAMSLEPGKHVTVRLPGGDSLPAHIEDDRRHVGHRRAAPQGSPDAVVVPRPHGPGRVRRQAGPAPVLLHASSTRSRAIGSSSSTSAEDVVQRRDYFRVEAYAPLTITTREETPRTLETTSHDLSAGGMLIADPVEIPAETIIDIQIKLEPGDPLRAVGRVIRNTGDKRTAVQIMEIAPADRQQLMRYITERQRAALRVAGGV